MNKSHRSIVAITLVTAFAVSSLARPHLAAFGDLMTAFVQPRRIELGLAGSEQGRLYAAYELDQLRKTFADVAEILPKYRKRLIPI